MMEMEMTAKPVLVTSLKKLVSFTYEKVDLTLVNTIVYFLTHFKFF